MRRIVWPTLVLVACLTLFGCSKQAATTPPVSPAEKAPISSASDDTKVDVRSDEGLFEALRSGLVQLQASVDKLGQLIERIDELKPHMSGESIQGLQDVRDFVDDAGVSLGDVVQEPPTLDVVKTDFKRQDDRRIRAISAANDARHSVSEALGIVESLLDSATYETRTGLDEFRIELGLLVDDLADAVKSLGGTLEEPSN